MSAQGLGPRLGLRAAGVAAAVALAVMVTAVGASGTPGSAEVAGTLMVVPTVSGADCGHGFYAYTSDPGVRTVFTTPPAGGRPAVVQQQLLDLDDPAVTQDTGAVATIGSFIPSWRASYQAAHRYRVRARAAYGTPSAHEAWGPWSATPNLLTAAPTPAPVTISSLDYPGNYLFGEAAGLGTITVRLPPKAIGFVYAWRSTALPSNTCATGYVADNGTYGYVKAGPGAISLAVPASFGAGITYLFVKGVGLDGGQGEATIYQVALPALAPGATDDADRAEVETARVTTEALTYRHSVVGSSGHSERVVVATGPGQSVSIPVTVPLDGRYSLQLAGTGTDHSGTVGVVVDGVEQLNPSSGEPMRLDLYQPVPTHTESYLAGLPLTAGHHTVTLVTGEPNPASRDVVDHGVHDHGSSLGLDFVRVTWLGA